MCVLGSVPTPIARNHIHQNMLQTRVSNGKPFPGSHFRAIGLRTPEHAHAKGPHSPSGLVVVQIHEGPRVGLHLARVNELAREFYPVSVDENSRDRDSRGSGVLVHELLIYVSRHVCVFICI